MWNLKKQMNKHSKIERDSQIWRTNRWLPEGRGVGVEKKINVTMCSNEC